MIKIDKKYIIKYSFEFVVIVLGISVSFWLNELSIDNQNEVERVKVLNSLKMEIQEIRNYTDEREKTWQTDLNLLNLLLDPKDLNSTSDSILKITTSKSRIETFLVIYRVFEPPMNRYYSIINSGDLKFVKSNPQAQQAIRGPLFEEKVVNSILETVTLKDKKLSVEKFKEQMDKLN